MIEIVTPNREHLEWVFAPPVARAATVSPWITAEGVGLLKELVRRADGATSPLPFILCFRPEVENRETGRITHFPALHEWAQDPGDRGPVLELCAHKTLHAKMYLTDRRVMVGSANLTSMGLLLGSRGNLEVGVRSDDPAFVAACWRHLGVLREARGWTKPSLELLANWADVSGLRGHGLDAATIDLVPASWATAAHTLIPDAYRLIVSIEFVRSAYAAMAEAAVAERPIAYSDLFDKLQFRVYDPEKAQALWHVLGAISTHEFKSCGLMLSAIVGARQTFEPGPGFYELAKRIGAMGPGKSKEDFFLEHQTAVLKSWAALADARRKK